MALKKFFSVLVFLCFLSSFSYAQEFTERDSLYFIQHLPRYEQWLIDKGFGALLKVHGIDPDPDGVTIFLESKIPDADSTLSAWLKLKANYAETHQDSLEACLFNLFCKIMQVPHEMAVIEICEKISLTYTPCFYRAIYFENEKLQTKASFCKGKQSVVIIEDFDLRPEILPLKKNLENIPPEKLIRKTLKKAIRECLERYYLDSLKAELTFLNDNDALVLAEVVGIRREILTDETQSLVCRLLQSLGYNCDWAKQEWITIKIQYQQDEGQHQLKLEIDGKYGSGFHRPRRNAYMSMEPEFEIYVDRYAAKIAEMIKLFLTSE